MKNKHLLEVVDYIEPGEATVAHLATVANGKRYVDLSSFRRHGDCCGWCNVGAVKKGNAKYCSNNCRESAMMYCYPQDPRSKAWVFINRQDCTCLKCGEIFEDDLDKRIQDRFDDKQKNWPASWKPSLAEYWYIGKRIGHLFDADHIVALCNGGRGIGLDNIQIICRICHHKKTAKDRTRSGYI